MLPDETTFYHPDDSSPVGKSGTDGEDLVFEALCVLRGGISADGGTFRSPTLARQKADLRQWVASLDLFLSTTNLPSKVVRGGQEHELFHDEVSDRYFKMTRNGVFGLTPGIDLALVSSDQDARRFHLWEASPLDYFERLHLQNLLVPGLNKFEGIVDQADDDLAVVISQPRFNIVPVSSVEIDNWFQSLGFAKVTDSSYYREEDNLGIFDAHSKNLVRIDDEVLIPFDVIPCHPEGGFLTFIRETLAAGHTIRVVRTVTTDLSNSSLSGLSNSSCQGP